jgi:hypothetical protein
MVGGRAILLAMAMLAVAGCGVSNSSTNVTATPAFSPGGGSYNASQTVTISDTTSGAVLYCTTDGTTPTTASPQCSQPATVFKSEFLQAIAVAPNMSASAVASAGYTINLTAAATPTFAPGGGSYTSPQTVAMSDATAGANIFYTTDGTTPTASSTLYTVPFAVSKSETISAIAVASGLSDSGVAIASYVINPVATAPVFSVGTGTYTSSQTVTITDATAGASIYYTTNGSTPSTASTLYSGPITVAASETINAIAVVSGSTNSAVVSAVYTINIASASSPTFSPAGGTYTSAQTVTLSDATAGASIYYTTDGSAPSASSKLYSSPISVTQTQTINAIAAAAGFTNSPVATAAYTINIPAATPVFSPAGGTYTSVQTVSMSDTTAGASIYYTTDGSTPTASSTHYSSPLTVSTTQTIKAIAVASGFTNSAVAAASFTLNLTPAPTPMFSPAGGTYNATQTVTITDSAAGAAIYYTIDGSAPTTLSTLYSSPIGVTQTETVKAIAVVPGSANSAVAMAAYTLNVTPTATPVFTPPEGTYNSVQTVGITDSASGAAIYYTTDGTTPTTLSALYSSPISVNQSETVKAIALASGFANSAVASATYTLNLPVAATPAFSLAAGTYSTAQTVTISDTTAGAAIYYTIDGTTPTASSTQYSAPISVSTTQTINAIAVASGYTNSAVASSLYTISIGTSTLSGTVFSGTQPVNGATVQLYAAAQTAYGDPGIPILAAPVSTNSSGAFTFSYNCPAAPGDLVYLVASGGDAGSGANTSQMLMLALGSCSSLTGTPQVVINEITTVASAYALSGFMTTAPNLGSSATNYQGLSNAFGTVSNLVDKGTGQALTITPAYAASPVALLNSSTVPQNRIDTLANALNPCVTSNGSGCTNLFSIATPTAGTAPANTLQAILNIAQHPGLNASSFYGLASPTGPFQPVLAAAPNDWTLALTFTGGGLGVAPGTTATHVVNTGLAIDATGDVWVVGYAPIMGNNKVSLFAEFSSLGAPVTTSTTQTTTSGVLTTTYGGYQPSLLITSPTSLAFDPSGNIWAGVGSSGGALGLAEISPSFSVLQGGLPTASSALSVAVDGAGNVWVGENGVKVDKYDNTGNRLSPTAGWPTGFSAIGQVQNTTLAFDSQAHLWAESNDGLGDLNELDTTNGNILFDPYYNPGGILSPVAADSTGHLYGCGSLSGKSKLDVQSGASMSTTNTLPLTTGRGCGGQMAIDGLGNIFAITGGTSAGLIDEFTTAGVLISPSAKGYTGTSSGEAPTINPNPLDTPKPTYSGGVAGNGVAGAALDGSGNLWVLNADTGKNAATTANVLVEYVGIGAPVVTPPALGLANQTLGKRP